MRFVLLELHGAARSWNVNSQDVLDSMQILSTAPISWSGMHAVVPFGEQCSKTDWSVFRIINEGNS